MVKSHAPTHRAPIMELCWIVIFSMGTSIHPRCKPVEKGFYPLPSRYQKTARRDTVNC